MSNENTSLGFNIGNDGLTFSLLEKRKDGQIELKELDYIQFIPSLGYDNILSQVNRKNIYDAIQQTFKNFEIKNLSGNLSLDSLNSFIFKIPFDHRYNDIELLDHIDWEFHQLFENEKREDYIITHSKIHSQKTSRPNSLILLCIKKQIVNFFVNIFEDLEININQIDIDHFALENVCKLNYREYLNSNIILISLKDFSVEMSLIFNGNFFNYRLIKFNRTKDIEEILKKEFKEFENVGRANGIHKIYLYSTLFKDDVINTLKTIVPIPLEIINPAKKLIINKSLLSQAIVKNINLFSPAIGIALRNFKI